jgi:hypothetical protein
LMPADLSRDTPAADDMIAGPAACGGIAGAKHGIPCTR